MKYLILLAAFMPIGAIGVEQQPLNCDIGPVKKNYGNIPWLVYSCNDHKTVVVISDTGSPAMPFYFTFYEKDGKYRLSGEGTGNKGATAATFSELEKMSETDINKIISETKQIKEHEQRPGDN